MRDFKTNGFKSLLFLWVLVVSLPALAVVDAYEFDNDQDRKRYHKFIDELRCPKCQNQNLSGSNSPIATDLRKQLYRLINEQAEDEAIVDYMVSRYGDFVLYDPPFNAKTMVLWLGPVVLLLLGLLTALGVIFRASKSKPGDHADVDPQKLHEIQKLLDEEENRYQ